MPNPTYSYSTNQLAKDQIGQAVDDIMQADKNLRWSFERRWYDNDFFDDGYHFRYLSRTQDKIVDLSQASTIWAPMRSIPKASRQIRGVSNLLTSRKFTPVVYPEKLNASQFTSVQEYQEALKDVKATAQASGHWIEEEFKKMNLTEKITLMIMLAAKHGVSYLEIWPDAINESLNTMVLDAFDVYVVGSLNELEDSPHLIKAKPRRIAEIKADERFDPSQVMKISPDNRFSSSEIKEAYAKARYGGFANADQVATVIEKEAFLKEYLDDDNMNRIRLQENGGEILKRRKKGDMVIRHSFVAGNICLKDEYLNLPGYPVVDFRFEPGPIYQVPLIERLKPQNKSLDLVVSRVERYLHTMVTGSWSVKSGEPAEPNNTAGGQVFKYNTTPPIQNPVSSVPPFVFNFMELLQSLIEEQGVTTTALGKLPKGVKANAAIESLKESEFANLSIAVERLKGTVKRIAEKMLDYADDYFVRPQTVYYLEKGEPQYFDIIGSSALKKRQELMVDEEPIVAFPIKRDYRVDIEVESGLAYTREGQRAAAKELGDYLIELAKLQLVDPQVMKEYLRKLLEIYQFGPTNEIMQAMDKYLADGQMTEKQLDNMKMALIEVFKDMVGAGVLPTPEQRIEEGKVSTIEALRDTKDMDGKQPNEQKPPSQSISFKDLPPDGKVQMAAQAGIQIDESDVRQKELLEAAMEAKKLEIQAKKGANKK